MNTASLIKAMRAAGVGETQILDTLAELDNERLAAKRDADRARKRRSRNRLINNDAVTDVTDVTRDKCDTFSSPASSPGTPISTPSTSQKKTPLKGVKRKSSSSPELEAVYERFRGLWPDGRGRTRTKRQATLDALRQALREISVDELAEAIENYAQTDGKVDGGDFVQGLQVWLNQRSYLDYRKTQAGRPGWTDDNWRAACRAEQWSPKWGPRPGSPGCEAPSHILKEFGFEASRPGGEAA